MMIVNSEGTSRYSAMTFTPPSDTSVIVQSRGSEPVPNWILAKLLHRRRSLFRRFINMSILRRSGRGCFGTRRVYREIIGICLAGTLAIYRFFLNSFYRVAPTCQKSPQTAAKDAEKVPQRIPLLQLSQMQKCIFASYFNVGLRPGIGFHARRYRG